MKITIGRKRIHVWGMIGLLGVCLNGWFAPPARAIPIAFTFDTGAVTGGFILDDSLTNPYLHWDFEIAGHTFNSTTDLRIANTEDTASVFFLDVRNIASDRFIFGADFTGGESNITYEGFILIFDPEDDFEVFGTIGRAASSVPEPTPGVLLMIGLLILAGARWWTHRQERLQWG